MLNLKAIITVGLLVILQTFSCWSNAAPPNDGLAQAANAAFAKGHYSQAAVQYQQLLQNAPDHKENRVKLAESYEFIGKLELAEKHAARVLERYPKSTEAILLMGRIRGRQEDWAESRAYYEEAVKADNNNASAHLGLGQALMRLGDEAAADTAFEEYRRLTEVPVP